MKRTYTCPYCHGILNPSTKIVLRGERGVHKGLFLFSPKPGNYDAIVPPGFELKKDDKVEFSCPICTHTLTSKRDVNLAEIAFSTSAGITGKAAFSRTYGQHSTYFITEEEVKSYGEHAVSTDLNFWGEGGGFSWE